MWITQIQYADEGNKYAIYKTEMDRRNEMLKTLTLFVRRLPQFVHLHFLLLHIFAKHIFVMIIFFRQTFCDVLAEFLVVYSVILNSSIHVFLWNY
jgi:hypothetical protein